MAKKTITKYNHIVAGLAIVLRSLPIERLICVNNTYCRATERDWNIIYTMDYFDEDFKGYPPEIVAEMVDDEFDRRDPYYHHGALGPRSLSDPLDMISVYKIAWFIVLNQCDGIDPTVREYFRNLKRGASK